MADEHVILYIVYEYMNHIAVDGYPLLLLTWFNQRSPTKGEPCYFMEGGVEVGRRL